MIDDDLQRRVFEVGEELAKLGQELGGTYAAELSKLGEGLASAYANRSPQASLILWGVTSAASWVPGLNLVGAFLQQLDTNQLFSENKQLKEDVAKLRQDVAELQLLIRR